VPNCKVCDKKIFSSLNKEFTILGCGHTYHRICIEKKLLLTKPNGCPECGKSVETITEATTTETDLRRDSQSSTSSIVGKMGKQLNIQSQEIVDEEMTDADNGGKIDNNSKGKATDIAEGSNKRPIEVTSEETTTTSEKSIKKAKKEVKNGDSSMLKKLIKELSSPSSSSTTSLPTIMSPGNFTDLYDAIIKAEERIGSTNQEVIRAYFLFGKKLEEKLAEYIKTNKERKAQRLLTKEVSAQLPSDLSKNAVEKE